MSRFGGFRVLRTRWKPHKSKDYHFLHRSYTPKIFSTPKKLFFRARPNIWLKCFGSCLFFSCPKGLLCRDLSKFVVRPSSVLSSSRPSSHSDLDRDFAKDACQELDSRSKPGPFGTFCKTSPYGRQSGCRTWPFLDHSRLSPDVIHHDSARHSMWEVFIVTQHIMTPHRLRKFERFLHNSPSGHPCPAGVI